MNQSDSLKVSLLYTVRGEELPYSYEVALPPATDTKFVPIAVTEIFAEIVKNVRFDDCHEQLPDPVPLGEPAEYPPHPTREEWFSEQRMFRQNTGEVWKVIVNTLLSAKYLLAQSRAYKEIELEILKEIDHRSQDVLNIHLNKMNAFDMAVYRLAKIEDLFLLLLFVNLGNSLVKATPPSKDWEKRVVWESVAKGLQERHPKAVSNRYLNQLSDAEYLNVLEIFNKFKSSKEVQKIISYRDATTHRFPPSVDYYGFSGVLVFPANILADGTIARDDFLKHHKVDHEFLDLYESAIGTYKHYLQVLRELKAIPRFA